MTRAARPLPDRSHPLAPPLTLLLLAATAVLASSVTGSLVTAIAASVVTAVAWRWGPRIGGAMGLIALAAALPGDGALRPLPSVPVLASTVLMVVAVAAPSVLRRGLAGNSVESRRRIAVGGGRLPLAASASPRLRRVADVHGHSSAAHEGAGLDAAIERDVVQRFLRDVRDSLGADAALLWQLPTGDEEPTLVASAEEGHSSPSIDIDPPVQSLLHWAVQQRMPASNYDTDRALFLATPVGADDGFLGALGLYVADRGGVARDRMRSQLVREGVRLGRLLDLFEDAKMTQRYRARAERLASAAERIQSKQDLETLGQAVCETALEVSGGTRAGFVVWNEQSVHGQLVSVSRGHPVPQGLRVVEESLVGTACRERLRFTIREAYRMSDFPLFGGEEPLRRVGSVGVVPLLRNHRALGAIAVEGDDQARLTAAEGELLSLLATVAAVALENVTHLAQVHERSMRDGLTGLRNRRSFDEHLRRYLRESDRFGQPVSLVLVDIDFFKRVNDTYGHDAGDAVLIAVAKAIENGVRNIDLCARFGGEELAILLPQTHLGPACEVAERLRKAVASLRVYAAGAEITVTASFGVASYPQSVRTHDALFTAADRALYGAKGAGRNCVKADGVNYLIPSI